MCLTSSITKKKEKKERKKKNKEVRAWSSCIFYEVIFLAIESLEGKGEFSSALLAR
jgi:hypothetical protein